MGKTFREQLNDNLWTTKGARFTAHSRLMKKSRISNITVGILSSYLIILGLLSVYNIIESEKINESALAFGSTAISILVLLFSQIEVANDFKVRALQHHTCALKISELHRRIQTFGIDGFPKDISEYDFCEDISNNYNKILECFDNHKTSDYNKFSTLHPVFFGLGKLKILYYNLLFYIDIYWLYSLLIVLPLIGFYWLVK